PISDTGDLGDKEVDKDAYEGMLDDDCKSSSSSQAFQDYQMYILDNVSIRSMACYEGIDESQCNKLGFGSYITASTVTPTLGEAVIGDTVDTPCAPGTTDLGQKTGYS